MKKTILAAAIIAIALTGCKKPADGATGPAGATGPNLSGTLEGYVDLFDAYGDLTANAASVYVTCPTKSGTDSTASNGMFTKSLSTGTYEIDFAKTGYGAIKIPSLNFVGGGTQYINGHIQMTQAPTYSLSTIATGTATSAGLTAISVTVTPSGVDTKNRKVICFLGTSGSVSYLPGNYTGTAIINIPANATTGVGSISVATANAAGVASGNVNTIYIAAYPIAVNNAASTYGDPATGKTIYNNINTASSVTTSTLVP
jgi:hypothetical protein